MLTVLEGLRHALVAVVRHTPDEQGEEPENESESEALRCEPYRARHQAETMNTVVPTSTWLNSHSASEMCIRMQPWDTE